MTQARQNRRGRETFEMLKKIDFIELIAVVSCLIFAAVISLYHLSYDGYCGLSETQWGTVWAISENGFSLVLCVFLSILSYGIMKILFKWVFIPYFILKLIYHFSCYSGIILLKKETWSVIWSVMLVILLAFGLFYCVSLIRKSDVV